MFKNILVGMDCDTQSSSLFQDALMLAKLTGGSLKLAHVFSFDEQCEQRLSPFKAEHPEYQFLDYLFDRWQTFLHQRQAKLGQCQSLAAAAGVSTVLDLEPYSGRPGAVLCKIARAWPADLLVVGHRDQLRDKAREMGELRLGSVSEYVLHHAPCAVLIDPHAASEGAGAGLVHLRHILVTIDASETSQSIFEDALSLAEDAGAELTVLHVQSSFEGDRPRELLKLLSSKARAKGITVHTELHHTEFGESVGQNICRFARKIDADLICVGRRRLVELQHMLLGSISHYVSYHSPCAVLVVHPSVSLNHSPQASQYVLN